MPKATAVTATRSIAVVLLVLVPVLAVPLVPLVGMAALVVAGLIVLVLAVYLFAGRSVRHSAERAWWRRLAALFGLLGGGVAASGAAAALASVGGLPGYSARAAFGWAALALALVAGAAGLLARTHPAAAGAVMVVGGIAGAVAINLFYINTWYVLAVPLWLIGALFAFLSPSRGAAGTAD